MDKHTRQYIKGALLRYPEYEALIEARREKILHPDNMIVDENIGGGSSNRRSDVVAAVAVRVAEDEDIAVWQSQKKIIDDVLQQVAPEIREVIRCRYFNSMTQSEVSDKLKLTVAVVRIYEDIVFRKLRKKMKLMA